ncbi:spermatogenesis-associated protein 2 [Austrofundulus limnaeus]|uniref:Spermatogenesis-associated protein 2 n=1 Tax=Austrofundulus limnaeus TaxID=52670 RepID=A0A2I4BXX5_AUSLI|nr:PREDICTED: spermatogenesis-associated protein 2 [Austrofundulus limnaeus]XP_013872587.1 PREDICTED: spermatogenesis-associated protein 2 [Austrofundulus limnaeus]
MDAKLKEDLFRRYVTALEKRLEEGGGSTATGVTLNGDKGRNKDSEALLSTATALLGAYQPDPGQRFRMVRFYEVVENSLRCQRGCNLKSLERAFNTLETICTNLLLFPWKKEFKCIKTFTGPYVYHLQSAILDAELQTLMLTIGYSRDHDSQFTLQEHPGDTNYLRQLAFELFLAQAECRLLGEVVALARGSASELEALELRRGCRDDAAGCAEALRRRDSLGADMARLSVRPLDIERPHAHQLRRGSRPSKSVDVTDGAGHWHAAVNKPVLKASLSLRKEPLFVDAQEDMKDEIIRPSTSASFFSVAAPPSYSPVADFFPIQSPTPADPYTSYHLSSLDEIDLYTEKGGAGTGGRQTPSRPPSREPRDVRDGWLLKSHCSVKCQGCGLACSTMTACQRCDMILCPACHDVDPSPCCGLQEYHSKSPRPLDGYIPIKEKLSVYSNAHTHSHLHPHPLTLTHSHPHSHPHPQMLEKPLVSTKLFPSKSAALTTPKGGSSERISMGGSRCGFCNKPGASHTCVNCSKVSCDSCMGLYAKDMCTRKNPQHNFVPNHQLNFKSGTISHLVYR